MANCCAVCRGRRSTSSGSVGFETAVVAGAIEFDVEALVRISAYTVAPNNITRMRAAERCLDLIELSILTPARRHVSAGVIGRD